MLACFGVKHLEHGPEPEKADKYVCACRTIEIKVLKQLVRDIIDPKRDLGHADRDHNKEEKQDDPAISTQVQNVAVADDISDPTTVEADPGNSGFHPKKTHNEDKVNTASCKDCR